MTSIILKSLWPALFWNPYKKKTNVVAKIISLFFAWIIIILKILFDTYFEEVTQWEIIRLLIKWTLGIWFIVCIIYITYTRPKRRRKLRSIPLQSLPPQNISHALAFYLRSQWKDRSSIISALWYDRFNKWRITLWTYTKAASWGKIVNQVVAYKTWISPTPYDRSPDSICFTILVPGEKEIIDHIANFRIETLLLQLRQHLIDNHYLSYKDNWKIELQELWTQTLNQLIGYQRYLKSIDQKTLKTMAHTNPTEFVTLLPRISLFKIKQSLVSLTHTWIEILNQLTTTHPTSNVEHRSLDQAIHASLWDQDWMSRQEHIIS